MKTLRAEFSLAISLEIECVKCGTMHASAQVRFLTRPIVNECFLSPQTRELLK